MASDLESDIYRHSDFGQGFEFPVSKSSVLQTIGYSAERPDKQGFTRSHHYRIPSVDQRQLQADGGWLRRLLSFTKKLSFSASKRALKSAGIDQSCASLRGRKFSILCIDDHEGGIKRGIVYDSARQVKTLGSLPDQYRGFYDDVREMVGSDRNNSSDNRRGNH